MSNKELRFDNRVVVVTGAGGGLGKQYALYFGKRGAKVVVNDLGGGMRGDDSGSSRPAELVAKEIIDSGGVAVANFASVEDGESVIKSAIDNFGRIDVLVNNAGILRDKSIVNTSDTDWDLVHRVHLRGSFLVTRAAWPHMRKQRYGRVIMTSSAAGIYGNFGQANYSSAKLGLLGLSNTLAIEGGKYNICCNTIAPIAGSRLTESVMPQELLQQLKPEFVAPLVLYLCHESSQDTGGLYEVGAGWIGKLRWERTKGSILNLGSNDQITPESVRDNWQRICDFADADRPSTIQESTANFVDVLQKVQQQQQQQQQQQPKTLKDLIGMQSQQPAIVDYGSLQIILYALGVGVSTSQPDHLRFLYEGSENFAALPTFGVVLAFQSVMGFLTSDLSSSIDPTRILHGEQYIKLMKAYPTSGQLSTAYRIADVIDKGSGAVIVIESNSTCFSTGDQICFNQFAVFVGGAGGFGGERRSELLKPLMAKPSRQADFTIEEATFIDQAALYRLSGDRNPLHIDPQFAKMGGQQQPILHGLCSFGIAARHVLKQFCDNDPSRFCAMKVRFTKPIVPGNTIVTEMWHSDNNNNNDNNARILVQCRVKETGEVCLSGGYVDVLLNKQQQQQQQQQQQSNSSKQETPTAESIFTEIANRVAANQNLAAGINSVFLWQVDTHKMGDRFWTFDLRSKPAQIYEGKPSGEAKPDCQLILPEATFIDMVAGKINPQKAFMSGKLKLKGNIMLSQKLEKILRDAAKL